MCRSRHHLGSSVPFARSETRAEREPSTGPDSAPVRLPRRPPQLYKPRNWIRVIFFRATHSYLLAISANSSLFLSSLARRTRKKIRPGSAGDYPDSRPDGASPSLSGDSRASCPCRASHSRNGLPSCKSSNPQFVRLRKRGGRGGRRRRRRNALVPFAVCSSVWTTRGVARNPGGIRSRVQ